MVATRSARPTTRRASALAHRLTKLLNSRYVRRSLPKTTAGCGGRYNAGRVSKRPTATEFKAIGVRSSTLSDKVVGCCRNLAGRLANWSSPTPKTSRGVTQSPVGKRQQIWGEREAKLVCCLLDQLKFCGLHNRTPTRRHAAQTEGLAGDGVTGRLYAFGRQWTVKCAFCAMVSSRFGGRILSLSESARNSSARSTRTRLALPKRPGFYFPGAGVVSFVCDCESGVEPPRESRGRLY